MKVDFRDIYGNSVTLELASDATVSCAIKSLSQKLKVSENYLLFVSPNENENFYPSTQPIEEVIIENPEYIVFVNLLSKNSNSNSFQRSVLTPNNAITSIKNANYNRELSNSIYKQYAKCLNQVPDDFRQKIDKIAVLGYKIEDIKEALRRSDYDVISAINMLVEMDQKESRLIQNDGINFNKNKIIDYNNNNINNNRNYHNPINKKDSDKIVFTNTNHKYNSIKLPSFDIISNKNNSTPKIFSGLINDNNNSWVKKQSIWNSSKSVKNWSNDYTSQNYNSPKRLSTWNFNNCANSNDFNRISCICNQKCDNCTNDNNNKSFTFNNPFKLVLGSTGNT